MSIEIDYLMNFTEFRDYVAGHVKNYFNEEYQNFDIHVSRNLPMSSGTESTALMIKAPDSSIAPAIYLDDYYSAYLKGESVGSIMNRIANYRMDCDKQTNPALNDVVENHCLGMVKDWNKAKERIIFSVVGNSLRGNSLGSRPSKSLGGDFVAVYNIDLGLVSDGSLARMPVTNSVQKLWGVTTEELHVCAVKNTSEKYPVKMSDMDEILQGFGCVLPGISDGSTNKPHVMVITNDKMINGAAALFYPGVLERVNEMYPNGFAILPSSIHEIIIAPGTPEFDLKEFSDMVQEINASIVSEDEQLSNFAHVYSPESHSISAPDMDRVKYIGESSLRSEMPPMARALAGTYDGDREKIAVPVQDERKTDSPSSAEQMSYAENYHRRSGR